eukprot:TRINITY_DN18592_c0_g1_i1.p1 TRINITY_DN18592_c0_g1~~TRINITY_DN18592_c0_g1_i1.p1  ORF type:complete len:145 (-),score=31.99 TRINITY_DN18592_c0_g1_i1:92-505(-)
MSARDDSFEQFHKEQIEGKIPCSLQFSANEFERQPDSSLHISEDVIQQVKDHLINSLEYGFYKYPSQVSFIAAQFKNANMRDSPLSPAEIEISLSKIAESLAKDENSDFLSKTCTITYADEGHFYGSGVRLFTIIKK